MGRATQIHSPGLFIRAYLRARGTAYPEEVHHAYRSSVREIPPDEAERILSERPDLADPEHPRLVPRVMVTRVTTPAGTEERVERTVYWLRTKYHSGRPQLPYRVARYAAFAAAWHILVRQGALTFVREERAPGRIREEHIPRFERGHWLRRPVEQRPKRRYYRITTFGERLGDRAWCNPKYYERLVRARETELRRHLTEAELLRLEEELPECFRVPSVSELLPVVIPPPEVLPPPEVVPPALLPPVLPELPRVVVARGMLDEAVEGYLEALATQIRSQIAEERPEEEVAEFASDALSDLLEYLGEVEGPEPVRRAAEEWADTVEGLFTALQRRRIPGLLARIAALIGE